MLSISVINALWSAGTGAGGRMDAECVWDE